MHSIWQEKIDFPDYPILKRDKKADVVYIGATLQHAVEAHFQHEQGNAVMLLEENVISRMPELGGMGILRAGNRRERKSLRRLREYIEERQIPCDMEVVSETCLWVHPVKLFLFMTEGIEVYEQTAVCSRQGKRLDIGSAYVDAAQIIEKEKRKEPFYVYVFPENSSGQMPEGEFEEMRRYKNFWLAGSARRDVKGYLYFWEI